MTTEDILDGFQTEEMDNDLEWIRAYRELCQEAVKDCMELNNQYHTPEEIREIMSRLTGKTIDVTFRLYPPHFMRILEKTLDFGRKHSSIRDAIFRIREELRLVMVS